MKLLLTVVLTTFSLSSFAQLSVTKIEETKTKVKVHIQSEERSSMCHMVPRKVSFILGEGRRVNGQLLNGTISSELSADPGAPCLTAFGPHRGTLVLSKGDELPQVKSGGRYRLILNGDDAGILEVE